jgi:DNA-binding transcriptional LysR family regulator
MRRRMPEFDTSWFALKADSDLAQLAAIRAGFGIGICQIGLARRDAALMRVLPDAFEMRLSTWVAMHENLRSTPRYRAVFDALAAGLQRYVDNS